MRHIDLINLTHLDPTDEAVTTKRIIDRMTDPALIAARRAASERARKLQLRKDKYGFSENR